MRSSIISSTSLAERSSYKVNRYYIYNVKGRSFDTAPQYQILIIIIKRTLLLLGFAKATSTFVLYNLLTFSSIMYG